MSDLHLLTFWRIHSICQPNKSNIRAHSIDTYLFGARELDISIYPWFALKTFHIYTCYFERRLPILRLGNLLQEAGSPGWRPQKAISQLPAQYLLKWPCFVNHGYLLFVRALKTFHIYTCYFERRLPILRLGYLLQEAGSPGWRPQKAISQLPGQYLLKWPCFVNHSYLLFVRATWFSGFLTF